MVNKARHSCNKARARGAAWAEASASPAETGRNKASGAGERAGTRCPATAVRAARGIYHERSTASGEMAAGAEARGAGAGAGAAGAASAAGSPGAAGAAGAARWDQLPDLVLTHVFFYLSDRDRVAASETCANWRRALAAPAIWRRMLVRLDRDLVAPPPAPPSARMAAVAVAAPGPAAAPALGRHEAPVGEPLALELARRFGQHVRRLELVWTRPWAQPGFPGGGVGGGTPPAAALEQGPPWGVARGPGGGRGARGWRVAYSEAGAAFLAMLCARDVQLRQLVLTDWVFSYKWGSRGKLLGALATFISGQRALEGLSLRNACLGVGEALRLLGAVARQSGGSLHALDLRGAFREWQAPHASPRYLALLARLPALTQLRLDYPALSDDALAVLAGGDARTLRRLVVSVRDTDNRQHALSDVAWRRLGRTCPDLRVLFFIVNIAHYEDLSVLLTPAIPLASFQLHSGSVWDQSRSRNFRATLRLLLTHYSETLEAVHLHVKNNREMLDDLLLELLNHCHQLSHLQYDGVLRDMGTVRQMCNLQLCNKTNFQTMHVRPRTLNAHNRAIVKDVCAEYVSKLAERTVDFKIEDPSSVIMFC